MSQLTRNALFALAISLAIIGTVLYAVNYLNRERIAQLNDLQDRVATDTLSVETQFALLEQAPCADPGEGNILSQEVSDLGERVDVTETRLGSNDSQVIELKKQYTLLQIRDYLLTQRLANSCKMSPTVALYFYSNTPGSCADCDRASYALLYLHKTYPALRVYAFDYNLDLGALKTLEAVKKVKPTFPAFVINEKLSYGFNTLDTFKTQFPASLFATTTATSTTATSTPTTFKVKK
jgi:hypothetical protein